MSYQVKIDIFEGPLDLLLHLIQKNDLDIYDIPISNITTEYLRYIEMLKELNLTVAGEFLVMAATLMQIKAQTLLPKDETQVAEGPDPRAELIQRLVEYQKFKQASQFLAERFESNRDVYYRGAPVFNKEEQILEVELSKLLEAFQSVLSTAEAEVREILIEEIPVEVRVREILDVLQTQPYIQFRELFPSNASRRTLVVTFLALLELIRLKQVRVTQQESFADIHISKIQESEQVFSLTSS